LVTSRICSRRWGPVSRVGLVTVASIGFFLC
jgi:hypothetical protein